MPMYSSWKFFSLLVDDDVAVAFVAATAAVAVAADVVVVVVGVDLVESNDVIVHVSLMSVEAVGAKCLHCTDHSGMTKVEVFSFTNARARIPSSYF
jgi:hypothetical protein